MKTPLHFATQGRAGATRHRGRGDRIGALFAAPAHLGCWPIAAAAVDKCSVLGSDPDAAYVRENDI
jgi:hypothetical protein